MTYEKSRSTWNNGFMGFKNKVTGKLSELNWEQLSQGINPDALRHQQREQIAMRREARLVAKELRKLGFKVPKI
jgi:hypothetical protein